MNPGALATIDADSIIERIAKGEYQSHIAREFGVAPQSLHAKIKAHAGYRQALELRNLAKLDQSQQNIETSPDLARAREEFKAAAWRAERECPEVWGQKVENIDRVQPVFNVTVTTVIVDNSGQVRATDVMSNDIQRSTIEQSAPTQIK